MSFENADERRIEKVWDTPTRVLHWTNVILILALMLSMFANELMEEIGISKEMREPVKELHAYIGHVFLVTFGLRILWGFLGNRYARWCDIIPVGADKRRAIGRNIRWYLSGLRGAPARVLGHDPLASLFYIALFIVLVVQSVTGILLAGAEFDLFPGTLFTGGLSHDGIEALEEVAEEIHEFGMGFMIFFISAHLIGLVVHEVKEKTGLFSSMIHGSKYVTREWDE